MDIYGSILSPYAARVVLAARYKGIKHKLLMPNGGTKTRSFLKMNPFGKMPTVKDGTTILFESGVIVDYIEAKHKKKPIVPASAKGAAQARLIGAVFAEYVQPSMFALFAHADPEKHNQKVVDEKLIEIGQALDALEKLMAAKPYAAGARFTIADCYAAPALFFLHAIVPQVTSLPVLGKRPKLKRYYTKICKDKLIGGVMDEMGAAMKAYMQQQKQS
jgi:glutathione S-transferase